MHQQNFVHSHRDLLLKVSIIINRRGFHLWKNYLEVWTIHIFGRIIALSEDNNVGTLLSGYGLALITNFDMIYPILKTRLLNYRV